MRNEIYEAAKFLSNLLRLHTKILSQEQLERFQSAIEAHLAIHYEHHWFPEKPNKGSAYRCIRINHKMDPIISKAGSQCGLDQRQLSTIFPNELTLWIDPREVAYRIGENGSICVLFDGSENNSNGTNMDQSSIDRSPNVKGGNNTNVNNKTRVNTNHNRASPTDTASLSSTTSTMSSPSPSSSPDQWCRTPACVAQSMDQNHQNGHHVVRRASPTAAQYGQAAHNFRSSMSDLNFGGGGQGNMPGYSFAPGAHNTNNRTDGDLITTDGNIRRTTSIVITVGTRLIINITMGDYLLTRMDVTAITMDTVSLVVTTTVTITINSRICLRIRITTRILTTQPLTFQAKWVNFGFKNAFSFKK